MIEAQPLIGRNRELAALERALREAGEGLARCAVLSGEPGIGKSSLVAELGRRATRSGWDVYAGGATELERDFPFGLLVDALDRHLASLGRRALDRLAADELWELASVFPALRWSRTTSPAKSPAERFRAHYAVRELIERLAARRPLLLVFDDIQWSDDASLELIAHLLRRPPDAAVMIAATLRTGHAPAGIDAVIEEAERGGTAQQFELAPLSRDEAKQLLAVAGASELESLYREGGGNPLYLLELARAARGRRIAPPSGLWTDADEVPRAIRVAIRSELDALNARVRQFAEAAAVVGDPFELDVAVAAMGLTMAQALVALDELIACEVLAPADRPRRFRFRHPLVRKAIYAMCPPGARLGYHERAAAALEKQGAPAFVRAHHVAYAARIGDANAARLLWQAGLEASRRAPASAATWLETAVRIVPGGAPGVDRLGLVAALADAYAATGRLEDSHAALLTGAELAAQEDLPTWVALTSACAKLELLLGHPDAAQARLRSALHRVDDCDRGLASRLMVDLASCAFYAADIKGVVDGIPSA